MVSTTKEAVRIGPGQKCTQNAATGGCRAHALHVQKQIMEGALRALAIGLGSLPVAHGRFADVARRLFEIFEEFVDGVLVSGVMASTLKRVPFGTDDSAFTCNWPSGDNTISSHGSAARGPPTTDPSVEKRDP